MLVKNALLLLTLTMPMRLYAQAEFESIYSLSLAELTQVNVAGATLTPKALRAVPSAATVFTHSDITQLGLDSLDELMGLVPGFQAYRSSISPLHYPFSARGRRIGSPSAEILILVDGQRLDEPRTSGSAVAIAKYPLMHIKQIEFIRGPGSALYGSNAMMGVINITTRSGVNEVGLSYGSFDQRQAYLLASGTTGELKLDLFAQMKSDQGDDYRLQDTFSQTQISTDDPRDFANLQFKLRWQQSHLNLQHNQFETESFYELDNLSNNFNERSGDISALSLQQGYSWQSVISHIWLSYHRSKFTTQSQLTPAGALTAISEPSSSNPLVARADFDNYSETRAQWYNSWEIDVDTSLQFGLEARHIRAPETQAKNNFDLADLAQGILPIRYYDQLLKTSPVQAASQRDIIGLYGQLQHQLLAGTHLTLGLRHDEFSSIGSQLSPRLALVQQINNQHSLKLLYGEAFRAPAENELNLLNNPVLLGDPNLAPETVRSWELIWTGQLRHKHWPNSHFSLGYFENHFKNAITQVNISGNLLQHQNTKQEPSKGIEFELSHEINKDWQLRIGYSRINSKPDISFREAEQVGSLTINYQQGRWNTNLIAIYQGQRNTPASDINNPTTELDDYWLLAGKCSYSFSPDWQGLLQIKNLLDKDYLTPASNTTISTGIANRGREISAELIWQF